MKNNKSRKLFLVLSGVILIAILIIESPWNTSNLPEVRGKSNEDIINSEEVITSVPEAIQDIESPKTVSDNDKDKLMTMSERDNVSVLIAATDSPFLENDNIVFEISFNTHSVNLNDYLDLENYIQLETNMGFIDSEQISWEVKGEGHHFGGILKIDNLNGKGYIIDKNTQFLNIILNNIVSEGQREHLYKNELKGKSNESY